MSTTLQITDVMRVGYNDYYYFAVGKIGDRWVGFAGAVDQTQDQGIFLLPGISHNFEIGLPDKEKVILLTGAIAQDPEQAYGGVTTWDVEESRRGKPEDFICKICSRVGCDGDCEW